MEGALPIGSTLPASRLLAKSIGVSRGTVEAAYAQLHAEGYIKRRMGSGTFVSEAIESAPLRGFDRRRAAGIPPVLASRGCALLDSGGVPMGPARAFTPGIPETRGFPLATWERLHRQIVKQHGAAALGHGDPQGEEVLRRAIADHVNLERGGRASPDRVVVLTSSQQAIWLCANVVFYVGDHVVMEDPGYIGARRAFAAAGLDTASVGVDRDGMVVDDLTTIGKGAKGGYVVLSHQYPTGAMLSLERRRALIEWALTRRAWIMEDDYDGEFHYAGKPLACIQGLDPYDRTIYIGTFTKSVFPGLRIAYLVVPRPLVQPMVVARSLLDGFTATMSQLTLARFIEGGHLAAHVRAMRSVYAERMEVLVASLSRSLGGAVEPRPPSGGLQMCCLLSDPHREGESIRKAKGAGVELVGLSMFRSRPHRGSGWLMGFAAYAPNEIREAVSRLATVMTEPSHRY